MGKKHTYEYVEQYFTDNGCELLEKRYVNNRTPCLGCHKEFHKKYGYKNNNKTQLKEYIN